MEIKITLTTSKCVTHTSGEIVREVKARRLLNGDKKDNTYLADDGECIVREFVVELEDYSDEDVKEYEAKHHNTPRKPKFRG